MDAFTVNDMLNEMIRGEYHPADMYALDSDERMFTHVEDEVEAAELERIYGVQVEHDDCDDDYCAFHGRGDV